MTDIKDFFENYARFVDSVTAEAGKNDGYFRQRQQKISEWLGGNYARFDNAVSGLAGEAGEVNDLWKKLKFHDKELNDENRDKLIDELSDVCWYLMQATIALNIPLDEVIRHNIAKLQQRHPHGFSPDYMKK